VEVTGFLYGEDLLATYQQSDLFVQLSTTETFGLCLVEALACGLPAVVLRSPGLTENLPPGHGVEVLEWDGVPTLGNRCLKLVSDKERHREFALRCGADAVLPEWVGFPEALVRQAKESTSPIPLRSRYRRQVAFESQTCPGNHTGPIRR
jgi:glycosyltransferase involved in cell wall biosynthesis